MKKRWKILNQERVFDSPWRGLDKYHVLLPSGEKSDFFMTVTGDAVMIFALTDKEEVVMNKQYHFLYDTRGYELPAGFVEDDDPLQTAKQELLEETGYQAEAYVHLGSTKFERWNVATIHYFLATDARLVGAQTLEDDEDIEIELVTISRLRRMLKENKIVNGPSISCAYMALDHLNKL